MANDFYIHGWVVRVDAPFFPLAKQGEMSGNYLLDPSNPGKSNASVRELQ